MKHTARKPLSAGRRSQTSGTRAIYHASSGLNLALYRAYYSAHARRLNRDPIGEPGGIELYTCVWGDQTNYLDPQGSSPIGVGIGFPGGFGFGAISSLIEGRSLEHALMNGTEDAVTGGITGLTDGLSLVPLLIRGAISGSAEAIMEEVYGCQPAATKIAFAVAAGH